MVEDLLDFSKTNKYNLLTTLEILDSITYELDELIIEKRL